MANILSARLAARTGTRQLDALDQADAVANGLERIVQTTWAKVLRVIRDAGQNPRQLNQAALHAALRVLFATLVQDVRAALAARLAELAREGYRSSAEVLATTLPLEILQAVETTEAVLEDEGTRPPRRTRRTREPVVRATKKETAKLRAEMQELIFPSPSAADVDRYLKTPVAGRTWQQDLAQATTLARPEEWAGIVTQGFAGGLTPPEIAKKILPAVSGVQSTARRIARTYGMQINHAAAREAHEQLGDMLLGYQIHAQLDQHTRSWHAKRSGTIYYAEPKEGQKGYAQMPNPPREADDPAERPGGTPQIAWH